MSNIDQTPPPKRPVGRPRKPPTETPAVTGPKRPVGRPRKRPIDPEKASMPKRGRGRPAKPEQFEMKLEATKPKRRCGRPRTHSKHSTTIFLGKYEAGLFDLARDWASNEEFFQLTKITHRKLIAFLSHFYLTRKKNGLA